MIETKEVAEEARVQAEEMLEAGASRFCLNRGAFAHLVANLVAMTVDDPEDESVAEVAYCTACDVWDEQVTAPTKIKVVVHPDGDSTGIKVFETDTQARCHVRQAIAEKEAPVPSSLVGFPFTDDEIAKWNEEQAGDEAFFIVETEIN